MDCGLFARSRKAFIGKLASKSTGRLATMTTTGGQSVAEKMRRVQQKEGQTQSWRRVESLLLSGDAQKRLAGLRDVAMAAGVAPNLAATTGMAAVVQRRAQAKSILQDMVSDPCWQVRRATLQLFADVACEANADFLPATIAATADSMWQVRAAACRGCACLCAKRDGEVPEEEGTNAAEAVSELVKDWHSAVALEALNALEKIAEALPWRPADLCRWYAQALAHKDREVRDLGCSTLFRLANAPGHEEATEATAELLEHHEPQVKEVAGRLLKHIGPTSSLIASVSSRMSPNYDEPTRCAALGTLAELSQIVESFLPDSPHAPHSPKEGRELNETYSSELRRVQERQQMALKAAQSTAWLGLQDPAAAVRRETIIQLKDFSPAPWQNALDTVQSMLATRSNFEPACRCALLQAVSCLFLASDDVTSPQGGPAENMGKDDLMALMELIASCFEDEDAEVREVAIRVLHGLTEGGRGGGPNRTVQAIMVAAQRLGHAEADTRLAAQTVLELLGGFNVVSDKKSKSSERGNLFEAARAAGEALGSPDPAKRTGAQRILVNLALQGKSHRVTAAAFAVANLKSEDRDVLKDVADTFFSLSAEGDPDILESVGSNLPSVSASTREVSLQILSALSPPGSIGDALSADGEAGSVLLRQRVATCLCDKVQEVRLAAIPAFAQLVRPEDETVSEVALRLPTLPSAVRRDNLESLVLVWAAGRAEAGPEEAASVACCLEDESREVRQLAVTLLRASRSAGRPDGDPKPTLSTEAALAAANPDEAPGERGAIRAVASRLRHRQPEVRQAAVEALAAVAGGGPRGYDSYAVSAAASFLDADRWEVRKSAVQAILRLVPPKIHAYLPSLSSLVNTQNDQIWAEHHDAISSMVFQCCTHQDQLSKRIPRLVQHLAEYFYRYQTL